MSSALVLENRGVQGDPHGRIANERELRVRARGVPRHVAVIMDGNGRWAEARGRRRTEGHRAGSDAVREITRCARRMNVEALTLYAFSTANWSRPVEEVDALMDLLCEYLTKERDEIMTNDIRLHAIGELDALPTRVRTLLDALRADSSRNRGMVLTLALSYSGRDEIVRAARALAESVARGELLATTVTERDFERFLGTRDLPAVDLLVRTSGEQRISDFLLWQCAYAEMLFTDVPWPDVNSVTFVDWIEEFQRRERRFGRTSAQVQLVGDAE